MAQNDLKMCQSCRALIPANAPRCEMCGAEGHYAARRDTVGEGTGLFDLWPVTTSLMTANLLVYGLMLLYQRKIFAQLDEAPNWNYTPHPLILDGFGAAGPFIRQTGEWWMLLSSCFLHADLIHIFFNSMGLVIAGRMAEEVFGRAQYLSLYLLSGIGGNLLAVMLGKGVVGASGCNFGLIAALALYGYKRRDTEGRILQSYMVYWLLYGVAMSFFPRVSMAAHLGGALVGGLLAWFLPDEEQLRRSYLRTRLTQVFGIVSCILILVTGVLAGRNVIRQSEALRVSTAAERVYTIWLNHLRMNKLLAGAQLRLAVPATSTQELPSLTAFAKQLDQTQKALCSDIGALERLPTSAEQDRQLYRRLATLLRARCDKPVAIPLNGNETELKTSLAELQKQTANGPDLDQTMQEYERWLGNKAASLHVPLDELKPQIRTMPSEQGEVSDPKQ